MIDLSAPVIIFGCLIAGLVGSLIHLFFGGKPLRMILSITFSTAGFWIGEILGDRFSIAFFEYGPMNTGPALVACVIFGLIGYWISGDNRPHVDE